MDQIDIETKPKISINLNEKEKAILDKIIKMDMFSSISPYLSNILFDGCIVESDADKIKEFVIDWITDNEGNETPGQIIFVQRAIIDRIDGTYVEQVAINQNVLQEQHNPLMDVNIDPENIPSYLNPVLTLIEREVRRRVKIEMKEHAGLQKKYDELKNKLENISQMFKV